jgi:hypothetical protein
MRGAVLSVPAVSFAVVPVMPAAPFALVAAVPSAAAPPGAGVPTETFTGWSGFVPGNAVIDAAAAAFCVLTGLSAVCTSASADCSTGDFRRVAPVLLHPQASSAIATTALDQP